MVSGFPFRAGKALFCVLLLVCTLAMPAAAQMASGERQLEVSPANVQTNSFRLNRLQRLEQDLTRTIKNLFGEDAADNRTVRRPPPNLRVAPQRGKDQDRRSDWLLNDPSSFGSHDALGSEDLRNFLEQPDRPDRKPVSPREQFLEDFLKQDFINRETATTRRGPVGSVPGESRDWLNDKKDTVTPEAIVRSEERLRDLLQNRDSSDYSSFTPRRSPWQLGDSQSRDVVDFGRPAQNPYIQEFRNLLNPSAPAGNDLVSSFLAPQRNPHMTTSAGQSLEPMASPKRDVLNPQFGSINGNLNPRAPSLPDPTSTVLNQWNPFHNPYQEPEVSRSYSPPKPTFEAPRRKF